MGSEVFPLPGIPPGSFIALVAVVLAAGAGLAAGTALLPRAAGVLLGRAAARARRSGERVAAPGTACGEGFEARMSRRARLVCGSGFAVASGMAAHAVAASACTGGADAAAFAAAPCWLACWAALLAAVLCDVAAGVLPREACWALAAAGSAFQLMKAGLAGLAAGGAFGVVAFALCAVCNRVAAARDRPAMVGGGDARCMAALSLATGAAAPFGFAACFAVAAAYAVIRFLDGSIAWSEGFPFAPFLCAWLALAAPVPTV